MIRATRPLPKRPASVTAVCARCGITRTAGSNTSPICVDCKSVLAPYERTRWAA